MDLQKVLKLGPNARMFIVDCHRLIHLFNHSDQNDTVVVLFTQDDEKQANLRYNFEFPLIVLANASVTSRKMDSEK